MTHTEIKMTHIKLVLLNGKGMVTRFVGFSLQNKIMIS